MLTKETVEAAIKEAERFIERARDALPGFVTKTAKNGVVYETYDASHALTSATRRASLDLTRALAEMRRR